LQQVQKKGSHDRRKNAYDTGYANGVKEGKKLADVNLQTTNDALQKRLGELLIEINTIATNQLLATQTAATFVIENQQLKNLVEDRERTIKEQADELETLRKFKTSVERTRLQVAANSGPLPLLGPVPTFQSVRGPNSPYFRR
jgi:hypothetical protein